MNGRKVKINSELKIDHEIRFQGNDKCEDKINRQPIYPQRRPITKMAIRKNIIFQSFIFNCLYYKIHILFKIFQ